MNLLSSSTRVILLLALMSIGSFQRIATAADALKCTICGRLIISSFYREQDLRYGGEVAVCETCGKLTTRCFNCGLPVRTNAPGYKRLIDGRYLCPRDLPAVIPDESTMRRLCETIDDELNRQFSRFLTFSTTNRIITMVDYVHLQSLFKSPGFSRSCSSVFGATTSQKQTDGSFVHSINLLGSLLPDRLAAVYAHELGHTWLNENLRPNRPTQLSADAAEGFCEFLAYKLMESRHLPAEQQLIKANQYTHGQIDLFLEAEQRYGLNTLIEWVLNGEDESLLATDPDRIRAVGIPTAKTTTRTRATPTQIIPSATPDRLVLRGISGTTQRRFALINDKTFQTGDIVPLTVGGSNLVLRCLEITERSATIQNEKTGEKLQLLLGDK